MNILNNNIKELIDVIKQAKDIYVIVSICSIIGIGFYYTHKYIYIWLGLGDLL